MDLLIPDSWLRKYLDTKAAPADLAKYLSLCGPSIERIKKTDDGDSVYSIEVTSNRVDSASVVGIAREAATILPRFGIKAEFKNSKNQKLKTNYKLKTKVNYLDVKVNSKLCPRFTAVLIKNVTIKPSNKDIQNLLKKIGIRPINNIVDISNFVMVDTGQPVHTFDYDKIAGQKMILRESNFGEKIKTLDEKEFILKGKDIVIEDGSGKLIDLCGIMGGNSSCIDQNTKNVLLFVQNYDKDHIRKTSMELLQRTQAATLFEKGLDSENVINGLNLALLMLEKIKGVKIEKEILDIYPNPYKNKIVKISIGDINKIIGINLAEKDIINITTSLGFNVEQQGATLLLGVPSWRAEDINIKEDIVEEIARIYGYHNLPSVVMNGDLSKQTDDKSYKYESKIRNKLKELAYNEVYNLSLVPVEYVDTKVAVKLKNPLGLDTLYLRTNLKNGLFKSMQDNSHEKGVVKLFELSNIYIKQNNSLPKEVLKLVGITKNNKFIENKTDVIDLLNELEIEYSEKIEDGIGFKPNQRIAVFTEGTKSSNKVEIGEYGNLENGLFAFEFDIDKLLNSKTIYKKYKEISKYPSQVEDLTLTIPKKTYIGEVVAEIYSISNIVHSISLNDVYNNNYTFRIEYHSDQKTLTDSEVEEIRKKIISKLSSKFGINT